MAGETGKFISKPNPGTPADYAEGWYFHFRSQNIGPISLRELKGRYAAGELMASDVAWHAAVDAWMPIRDVLELPGGAVSPRSSADEEIVRRLRHTEGYVLRNGLYLVLTSVPALILLLSAFSMLSYPETEAIGMLLIIAALILVWWAWLEFRGVQLPAGQIVFAARLPFWPSIMPYRMLTVNQSDVTDADVASSSDNIHVVVLRTSEKNFRIVFDTIFARDTFLFLLSLRSVTIKQR